ncbi:MAG: ammonia channel protein [Acidiferrobacteraceae bacterium]|jgi:Amt family ammonium transporter|nr:ammonia channel protein [Acidiferrobacteraceae bacterium]MCP4830262.1 ammonium transporter [Pseudomonadota bacterium]|tara:strand:+ start:3623 stop:4909 length:1287 start_codon:yes stop_codon:yes gene_type:complete
MRMMMCRLVLALVVVGLPAVAWADVDSGDTAWLLTSTALVLFMTIPGLALFYAGLVRTRNVLSVLMQCFILVCAISVLWVTVGYTLAFGAGGIGGVIGGLEKIFLRTVTVDSLAGTIPESVFVVFQLTFAAITPALIVGGFAERMNFAAMLIFCLLWTLFAYVPVAHWVWGGGWLAQMGVMDFAGGAVVHVNAGVAALVAAMVLGRRRGFPQTAMLPHNMTMTVTGAAMLWVGWFGFNAGSAVAADGVAGMAMLVTHTSAAAGALMWMAVEWVRHGKPSALGAVTGMVAGLGTITPASGFVGPMGALLIGASAGFICYWATQLVKQHWVIDDSLDVFPVHGVGGALGMLLTSVFVASTLGGAGLAPEVSMISQFMVQSIAVIATAGWSALVSYLALKLAGALVPLRVGVEEEIEGLDLVNHEERGYNL